MDLITTTPTGLTLTGGCYPTTNTLQSMDSMFAGADLRSVTRLHFDTSSVVSMRRVLAGATNLLQALAWDVRRVALRSESSARCSAP
eukprot:scaffold182928_cov28-Tisochrysis_lutea.AAC.1